MSHEEPRIIRVISGYDATATGHWSYCEQIVNAHAGVRSFFYAALELRLCIERLCFEYLALLTYRRRKLSKSELKLYKPKDILKRVNNESPDFKKRMDFLNALLEVNGSCERMKCPDTSWLEKTHGKLGDYLHAYREPPTQEELIRFGEFVKDTLVDLKSYIYPRMSIVDLRPHAQAVFDEYVAGRITLSSLTKRLEIATIPMHLINPPGRTD
ncbi:MAG: hypothetical protein AB1772_07865 [Candidatus Zixiibacteriota bacterium]